MPLQPSRRDTKSATSVVRHHQSYLRSLDPGFLDGTRATPQLVRPGPSTIVGGSEDSGDSGNDRILFINTDQFTIDGPGDKVFLLSYAPIQDGGTSLHVRWVPLYVPTNNWTCEDNVLRVSDPGWHARDLVEVAYAYEYDGEEEPSESIADFGATGWRWLQIGRTDGTDYSSPTFDDSAWALGVAPFGETDPAHDMSLFNNAAFLDYVTVWSQNTRMWARRAFDATPGEDINATIRFNRYVHVWINGYSSYASGTSAASNEYNFVIPGEQVFASNVIAIQVTDDTYHGAGSGCYFDLTFSQEVDA